jgi:hypothetical protein
VTKPIRPIRRAPFAVSRELAVSLSDHLVDEMLVAYVSWREECEVVRETYADCASADARDRKEGFWAYLAALEREERAAAVYACRVEQAVDALKGLQPPLELRGT